MVLFDSAPVPLTRASQCVSETIDTTAIAMYGKKTKRLRLKSVSFSTETRVIGEFFPYTEEEKHSCFYNRKDRRLFEDDRLHVCQAFERMYRNGETWRETEEMTLRGLEDFFGRLSKEELRKMHAGKVLGEQERQQRLGEDPDEVTLRYVSSESSGEGRAKALQLAKHDAMAAGISVPSRSG